MGQGGAVTGACACVAVAVAVVLDTVVEQGGAITGHCDVVETASTDEVGGATGLAARLTVTVVSTEYASCICSDHSTSLGSVMPSHHGAGEGASSSSRPKWIWGLGPRSSTEDTGDAVCVHNAPESPAGGLVGSPAAAGMAFPAILAPPLSCPCTPHTSGPDATVTDMVRLSSDETGSVLRRRRRPRGAPSSTTLPSGTSADRRRPSRNRRRGTPREARVPYVLLPLHMCLCPPQRHMAAMLGGIKEPMAQLHVFVK